MSQSCKVCLSSWRSDCLDIHGFPMKVSVQIWQSQIWCVSVAQTAQQRSLQYTALECNIHIIAVIFIQKTSFKIIKLQQGQFYCTMSTFTFDTLSALFLIAHHSKFSPGFKAGLLLAVKHCHSTTLVLLLKDLSFFHHWDRVSRKISVHVH